MPLIAAKESKRPTLQSVISNCLGGQLKTTCKGELRRVVLALGRALTTTPAFTASGTTQIMGSWVLLIISFTFMNLICIQLWHNLIIIWSLLLRFTSFDNLLWSMLTTFQLITLDYWENVYNMVRAILDDDDDDENDHDVYNMVRAISVWSPIWHRHRPHHHRW